MGKETTSSRIAKIAAKGMKSPEKLSRDEIVAVCASCLTQYELKAERNEAKEEEE